MSFHIYTTYNNIINKLNLDEQVENSGDDVRVEQPQGDFIYPADSEKAGFKESAMNFFLSIPLISYPLKYLCTAFISHKMSKLDAYEKIDYLNSFRHPENSHLIKFLQTAFKTALEKITSMEYTEEKKANIGFIDFPLYVKLDSALYSECKEILKRDIIELMKKQNYYIAIPSSKKSVSQEFILILQEIVQDPLMANKVISFHNGETDQTAFFENGKAKWVQNLWKI